MFRLVVACLCGMSISGSVYMAGWGSHHDSHDSHAKPVAKVIPAGIIDMKNTKCIVMDMAMGEADKGDLLFVTYQGKAYHICCSDCESVFNKEPEKFVKIFEADPAKFGVTAKTDGRAAEKH